MSEIDKAIDLLNSGEVVGIPTETVYGLGASIYSEPGLNKIFHTKERPFFNPLIVHVSDIEMAKSLTSSWCEVRDALAKTFWPGPLTIIALKNEKVSDLITAAHSTVGLRCPNNEITLELIKKSNLPLAAPSANKFKRVSPVAAFHVKEELGDDVFVLDGGECQVGIESTIIDIVGETIKIYRPGIITPDEIKKALAHLNLRNLDVEFFSSPVAPGQLKEHYKPKIPVVIKNDLRYEGQSGEFIWLMEEDPYLVARNLYANFRKAEKESFSKIVVLVDDKYKSDERYFGILNRLQKATN
jgi:L-threonylcarbamoyladenylate synthase